MPNARPAAGPPSLFQITKDSIKGFGSDQCTLRAAALSYFTVFALPPLLVLLMMIAGLIWSPQAVERALESQFAGLIGAGGASVVKQMIISGRQTSHGLIGTVLGFAGLIASATGAFLSLQEALNVVWRVGPDPKQGGIKRFITKRLLSLGMVMGVAFLLVVSLALTAALSALGSALGGTGVVMQIVSFLVSMAVLAVLFAAMFKFLPDAMVAWRSVWLGGALTAVLFEVGKFVIGLYLGHSKPGNPFGAASALAVILVWIYYAGMLVLFGAEFTTHFAQAHGEKLRPKSGAVRMDRDERIVRDEGDSSNKDNRKKQDSRTDAEHSDERTRVQHAAIRQDIEATRARMGTTLEQLGTRLSPGHLAEQATEKIREAAVGQVETMARTTADRAATAGQLIADAVRDNPVPAALIAVGIGWLALNARRSPPPTGR